MRKKDIEQRLQSAISHGVPNVLDRVLADCEKPVTPIVQQPVSNRRRKKTKFVFAAAAAAVLLFFAGTFAYSNYMVDSVVGLNVNPSVEIKINRLERVVDATGKNQDGKIVIGDMDLKGTDLEVAVNAVIGSMLQHGYLNKECNLISVVVENKNQEKSIELEEKISIQVENLLKSNHVNGLVNKQMSKDSTPSPAPQMQLPYPELQEHDEERNPYQEEDDYVQMMNPVQNESDVQGEEPDDDDEEEDNDNDSETDD